MSEKSIIPDPSVFLLFRGSTSFCTCFYRWPRWSKVNFGSIFTFLSLFWRYNAFLRKPLTITDFWKKVEISKIWENFKSKYRWPRGQRLTNAFQNQKVWNLSFHWKKKNQVSTIPREVFRLSQSFDIFCDFCLKNTLFGKLLKSLIFFDFFRIFFEKSVDLKWS